MATWAEVQRCEAGKSFRERLEADERCTLTTGQLDAIFDPKSFLARVGVVFERLEGLSFDDEGQSGGA